MTINLKITQASNSCKVSGTNHLMKCTTCDKNLGTMVESDKLSKKFNKIVKYQCICSCGGESFVVKSVNECYFAQDASLDVKDSQIEFMTTYVKYQISLGIK